jgi:4-deoxy-L-threo-5-hexosulose-uronate ketol-isomerase
MKNTIETRKACNQREPATKNTTELRENFLTAKIFLKDEIQSNPAKFYFNSAAVHHKYSTVKVSKKEAEIVTLGSLENSNHCAINKLLVASVIETCQLQMGMTELKQGSVWNLMPAYNHELRKEVYFYFKVPEGQPVCHFMGELQESRLIWIQNKQAVMSPSSSIIAGADTSSYTFICGMACEKLDYGDMDLCPITELK